ncbi:MAG: type II toxin-antitoxin system prevent-host-death family antitoxin [Myxococcota bacterium]|nr:type II toxin-antitoxin system prevent-host-death family antitoxin [Myxococcota bacterium]
MRTAGVGELRARLSRYLDEVKRGEVVLVTDRGKVVAEIRPPASAVASARDEFERRLDPWVRAGRARLGAPNEPAWYLPAPVRLPAGTAQRVLDALRDNA